MNTGRIDLDQQMTALALARVAFKEAIAEKPSGRFMIRGRTRVVKRHRAPERRRATR